MLDPKLKQAYQKITPSSDLKHRILSMHVEPQQPKRAIVLRMKTLATVAACLVMLLGGMMLASRMQNLTQTEILLQGDITLNEQELRFVPQAFENSSRAAMPRVASATPAAYSEEEEKVAVDFCVDLPKKTEITVEQGSLYVGSELQGVEALEEVGQNTSIEQEGGMTLIRWVIPVSDEDVEYRMTIGKDVIRVIYRESANEYFVFRSNAES